MDVSFRITVAVVIVGFMLHRGFYTRKIRHSEQAILKETKPGRITRIVGLLALPALASTAVYVVWPRWLSWSTLPLPAWVRWSGAAVAAGGFALPQWAQQSLGGNWSDEARLLRDHELVKSGPYRYVRHPIYTSFLAILGSLLFISANWLVGGLWIAMTGLDVGSRISVEEALMAEQFGQGYHSYRRTTGRLLPRIGRPRAR